MIRSKTKPVSVCTGNGKHKKPILHNDAKELFKQNFLQPDCKIKPFGLSGEEDKDKDKPKKFRVIPLHNTIHIVSAAEIHAYIERERIKREKLYVSKQPPVKKATTGKKKFEIVEGLNAIKEVKDAHWEKFPSVVEHQVANRNEEDEEAIFASDSDTSTISDTEIEEMEKLILPQYPFQCNFQVDNNKLEGCEVVNGKIDEKEKEEERNGRVENVDIEKEGKEVREKKKTTGDEEEKEININKDKKEEKEETDESDESDEDGKEIELSTKSKDEKRIILVIIATPEAKIKCKIRSPRKIKNKREEDKREEPEEKEEKNKIKTPKQTKNKNNKEATKKANQTSIVQNKMKTQRSETVTAIPISQSPCRRITRSQTKIITSNQCSTPDSPKRKMDEKSTEKAKSKKEKGKNPTDNGVARGKSIKKKIKINFHDKKNQKRFKTFSLAFDTE